MSHRIPVRSRPQDIRSIRPAPSVLNELVRNAPLGVALLDSESQYLYVNETLAEMTGVPAEGYIGRTIQDVLPALWREVKPVYQDIVNGDSSVQFDVTGETAGEPGGVYVWRTVWYPIQTRKDARSTVLLLEDVTAQHQTEELLSQALAARDEFVGFVSHELRGPLTIIQGYASILSKRSGLRGSQLWQSAVDEILRESVRLNEIISNLVAMARFDQGMQVLIGPHILRHALCRAVEEFQEVTSREVFLSAPERTVLVSANEGLLSQVVRNLLSNAEKYSPQDSPIRVEARETPDCVIVSVTDEGGGFDEEEAEKLFEPYYRRPESQSKSGLGIGLTVCRRLVELMGGNIWVETRNGGGTTFSFSLLRYQPAGG